MEQKELREALKKTLKRTIDRLNYRRKDPESLSWCFSSLEKNFIPDYFLLSDFGRSKLEQFMNSFTSKSITGIWSRFVWTRFTDEIHKNVQTQYIHHYETEDDYKALFMSEFSFLLHNYWKSFTVMTFTELFSFTGECLQLFADMLGLEYDLYSELKVEQNNRCFELYQNIRDEVVAHPRATAVAAYLALRANWMDVFDNDHDVFFLGFLDEANRLLDDPEVLKTQEQLNPYFQMNILEGSLSSPKKILYELDNSGECVLDLLFVEILLMSRHTVTLVAKSGPFLNDVTVDELIELLKRFEKLQDFLRSGKLVVLESGLSFAGKLLYSVTEEYKVAYEACDLKILKGQGHFQTSPMGVWKRGRFVPYSYKKPMFFLSGIRADLVQRCAKRLFGKAAAPQADSMFLYSFMP